MDVGKRALTRSQGRTSRVLGVAAALSLVLAAASAGTAGATGLAEDERGSSPELGELSDSPSVRAADVSSPVFVSSEVEVSHYALSEGSVQITVRVRITDQTATQTPIVIASSENTSQSHGFGQMTLESGDSRDGTWVKTISIPDYAAPGEWSVDLYPLRDSVGNSGYWFRTLDTFTLTAEPAFVKVPTPSLIGSPTVGSTLEVTSANADAFLPQADRVMYQWLRDGSPIKSADSKQYTLVPEDGGKSISVQVTGIKDGYPNASGTSSPAQIDLAVFSSLPDGTITGTATVGQTLTVSRFEAADFVPVADGVSFQWNRNGDPIAGATSGSYKLMPEDALMTISVIVYGNRAGYVQSATELGWATVSMADFSSLPKASISGTPRVGQTLKATGAGPDAFTPVADSVSYQWLRSGSEIANANKDTYLLGREDGGKEISVRVTGSKTGYQEGVFSSSPLKVATVTPNSPAVSRLQGPDRYATNLAINVAAGVRGGPVFIATGTTFADALSIGPVVRNLGGNLFLTPPNSVRQDTLTTIKALSPSAVYIVGGTGAVSDSVASKIGKAAGQTPVRIAGADRYSTSEAIYKKFFVNAGRAVEMAFVATGLDYPDALSAASAGGALGAPVLLVNGAHGKQLSAALSSSLESKGVSKVLIVGGRGAVNATIESNLKRSFSVQRLQGEDRYATNLAVNSFLTSKSGSTSLSTIWIATGLSFPDALSAAAPAGNLSSRLVLTPKTCIPKPVVSDWITKPESSVRSVYLAGGTGVLPMSIQKLTQCK